MLTELTPEVAVVQTGDGNGWRRECKRRRGREWLGTARTEGPCPDTLRDEIVFTPPEISGSIDGIEIPTQDLSRRPEERCNATVELRDWRNCFEDTPPPRDMYVELECYRNNQRFLTASIRIGDIRDTPVGSADVYA